MTMEWDEEDGLSMNEQLDKMTARCCKILKQVETLGIMHKLSPDIRKWRTKYLKREAAYQTEAKKEADYQKRLAEWEKKRPTK